jgi:acetolactate synthase-1/2/3 large subunit
MASYDTPFTGNYAGVAESLGGYGERVESPAEITPAIERGIERTRNGVPALLEFITAEETAKSFV